MEENNELKLYSISAAASNMGISRDTVRELINKGKIGFIPIGNRKKIPHREIVKFQKDSIVIENPKNSNKTLSANEIKAFLSPMKKGSTKSFSSKSILDNIIRNNCNGDSTTEG
jgi:excisionase family DNA binding protein